MKFAASSLLVLHQKERDKVTEPPILILDESTAGFDPVSEAQVLDKLFSYRQGKTAIMISHVLAEI